MMPLVHAAQRAAAGRFAQALLLGVALLLLVPSSQAQRSGTQDPAQVEARMAERVDGLLAELELSEEKAAQVHPILMEGMMARMTLMREMRQQGGDRMVAREQVASIEEETTQKLASVLDEAEMARYKELQSERRRPPRRNNRPG